MRKYDVVSPLGIEVVKRKGVSPRLADLNGKTEAEVWNGVFKGDQTFPIIRKLLQRKFPSINISPFTEFLHYAGGDNPNARNWSPKCRKRRACTH